MANEEKSVEARGENVEKAIESGLKLLGLSRDDVDVEILDQGSAGFLGIGSREASVRISKKPVVTSPATTELEQESDHESKTPSEPDMVVEAQLTVEAEEEEVAEGEGAVDTEPLDTELAEKDLVENVVGTLLEKMQIQASITTRQTEPDDLTGERRLVIDIRGDDLGILIGPRGETLNSLQYLSRLIVGHALRKRPKFIIDVEGYRERRELALARLAERMANKTIQRGRPVSLEPMPPNERRIIHITLRDDDRVYTESAGEGDRRKVRIFPKD